MLVKPGNHSSNAQLPLPGLESPQLSPFQTDNLREIRILRALWAAACSREELDEIAGCANGPDQIHRMRCRGLDIPSVRLPATDRDGETVYRGRYQLSAADRLRVAHLANGGHQ